MTNNATDGPPDRFHVAVVGAGVIGTSVAFACLLAGHPVVLVDQQDKDWADVRSALRREQRRARLSQPSAPAVDLDGITFSHDLADVSGSWIVVENVSEDWAVKSE
ncbi:MAG: 3-hydroxyacyl-CoA dehydrogenase NAD-binding domain-containing protein, partial [Actinomycetota bacterium]|nr:3-hydroxyacyl-CoA dehydrogenase NAD-binding domain-containing protein [Actinomycetota bacterium]